MIVGYLIYLIIVSSSRITSQGLSAALGSVADLLMMAWSLAQCPEIRVHITFITSSDETLSLFQTFIIWLAPRAGTMR